MIIIGGKGITLGDLPFSDLMTYSIDSQEPTLAIKLKTAANSNSCIGVYLHQDFDNIPLTDIVKGKTNYFSDLDDLKHQLENMHQNGVDPEESLEEDEEETTDEITVFSPNGAAILEEDEDFTLPTPIDADTTDVYVAEEEMAEEVDFSMPTSLTALPELSEDVDALKLRLETKEKIILQQRLSIKEMQDNLDGLYEMTETQLLEQKDSYEKMLLEANKNIVELKTHIQSTDIDFDSKLFLKYKSYADKPRAALKERFTEVELDDLGKITSNITILAADAGGGFDKMLKGLDTLIQQDRTKALIVDFSNNMTTYTRYKLQTKGQSLMLNDNDVAVSELVANVNGVEIIPSGVFNDIALLTIDWIKVLKKILLYASGRPIILVFGYFNGFTVKYPISKLATLGSLYIFAKCSPVVLASLYSEIKFIPAERVNIAVVDFYDAAQSITQELGLNNRVIAFKDAIEWSKLGIKE